MNASLNTTTAKDLKSNQAAMSSLRKTSLTVGILYLFTFVSIPTLALYSSIHEPNFILGTGEDNNIVIGGILEILVALTCIGTAVALFPVLKKQSEGLALGLMAFRVLEAGTIFVGVAFLLSAVTLKQSGAGSDALVTIHALVALYDRIFLLGQGFIPGINDLILGYLLYKSRLVPRALSIVGMAGALPLFAGYFAVMFGLIDRISPLAALSPLMVAVFEFSLGLYLVIKGFRSSDIAIDR